MVQQPDAPGLMHGALGLGQRRARRQPRAGVVEAGHGQEIMSSQHLRPQVVDLVRQDRDLSPGPPREVGKGEGVETGALHIDGVAVIDADPRRVGDEPLLMQARRQDAQNRRVVTGDHHQLVVRQDVRVQKPEPAVLGRLDRGDIAPQAFQRRPQFATRLAENPPVVAIRGPVVAVPLGLHRLQDVLKDRRVTPPRLALLPAEQVDDVHAARPVRQIAAVAIGADRRGRLGL
ncbi:hypothetical protein D3C72_778770 [compost metagenome]